MRARSSGIWNDLERKFGRDLLRERYAQDRAQGREPRFPDQQAAIVREGSSQALAIGICEDGPLPKTRPFPVLRGQAIAFAQPAWRARGRTGELSWAERTFGSFEAAALNRRHAPAAPREHRRGVQRQPALAAVVR